MRKRLRELGLADPGNPRLSADVGAKKKTTNPKMTPAQAKELREEILPAIDKARQALVGEHPEFSDMRNVAEAAGHGIATWHAWRRKNAPTSPKFFDLRDFARAVGLDVGLLGHDAVDASASVRLRTVGGEDGLHPETAEVVRLMETLPDDARAAIRDAAFKKNGEMLANPQGADESPGSPVRSNKS